MSRRTLLPLTFVFSSPSGPEPAILRYPPTDIDKLNRFASDYNAYVADIQKNIVNTAKWKRTKNSWDNLLK